MARKRLKFGAEDSSALIIITVHAKNATTERRILEHITKAAPLADEIEKARQDKNPEQEKRFDSPKQHRLEIIRDVRLRASKIELCIQTYCHRNIKWLRTPAMQFVPGLIYTLNLIWKNVYSNDALTVSQRINLLKQYGYTKINEEEIRRIDSEIIKRTSVPSIPLRIALIEYEHFGKQQ